MPETRTSTETDHDEKASQHAPATAIPDIRHSGKSARIFGTKDQTRAPQPNEKHGTNLDETEVLTSEGLKLKPVRFSQLFRFATWFELWLDGTSLIAAAAAGAAQPLMTLLFGRLVQDFVNFTMALYSLDRNDPESMAHFELEQHAFYHSASLNASYLVYIGIGMLVCTYAYMMAWGWTSEVLSKRIREHYLRATLRQDIAYFDNVGAGEIATRIQTDTDMVQKGIGEKVALSVTTIAAFITGYILAYVQEWRLALAMTAILPPIVFSGGLMNFFVGRNIAAALRYIAEAGSVAEEVISSIRTVQAFGIQDALTDVYRVFVLKARKRGISSAMWIGTCISIIFFAVYNGYALAFYFGTTLIIDGHTDAGGVVNVIFAILIGTFSLVILTPQLQAIQEACGAAAKLYYTIDRVPAIDSYSPKGLKPEKVIGDISLENIVFHYPSRPTVPVVRNVNLRFRAGLTSALVGASGSGKSTAIALIERFYDPKSGTVRLDGVDIRDLNIKWLRSQIGLVSQEPTLFNTTVAQNVMHGLINTPYEHATWDEKMKLVVEACKLSNADNFIQKLPEGYETLVGERAILLSGGQKQRIAIARAIVSDPKVLLLDEATSALDTQSEGIVQNALDKASAGRTTITIAHRLSTIKDADIIYVMGQGEVLEQGSHNELLRTPGSAYAKLVEAQKIREAREAEAVTNDVKGVEPGGEPDEPDDINPLDRTKTRQSLSSQIAERKREAKEHEREQNYSVLYLFWRMIALNKTMHKHIILGIITAAISGAIYPVYGIVFSSGIVGFSEPLDSDKRHEGNVNARWLFIIAIIATICTLVQNLGFVLSAVNLMATLRQAMFTSILCQDVAYFDEAIHSTGSLVSQLSDDPQKINGLAGMIMGTVTQALFTLIVGWIIGLVYTWKLGLVGLACTPLVFCTGLIRLHVVVLKDKRNKKEHEDSAEMACEAAGAIRTVAALTREEDCLDMYSKQLLIPLTRTNKSNVWSNLLYAMAQSIAFFVIALIFWFGAKLVSELDIDTNQFFIGLMCTTFAAINAGNIFNYAADMSEAKSAADSIISLFDSMPEIDARSPEGKLMDRATVQGRIEFKDVHFRYPSRTGVRVLSGLNLTIEPGMYVALVGASGCGKSTTIQLAERFYDPWSGQVLMDGMDLRDLNVASFRSHISLVSQEPTLYSGTVRFNILLGAAKPVEEVTQEELEAACRNANILDFILSLPEGFDTQVGGKGSQLSGGQKQRIAIARALLRSPKVLLLDEATSALDSTSEKVVQAALDQAAKGRTTIAIAHRLSTIQNADRIYFIKDGKVAEWGTHDELINRKGHYYEFVQLQALSATG
ncbi:ste6-like protein [Cylindrobasidium torrendii FP15055 ss-10]|uniref:Ste6-like protein n=1 Tax=Cylindrobasidium torrendii FP15055 ss-10 TaxID=1314674 RepID=A0A0D7BSM1_9AGAR|nr:ste6-like protein [Cylindrobasidium torrendii FP15055 ss-10]